MTNETISNEEKARDIAEYTQRGYLVVNTDDNTEMISTYNYCYDSAMQMAQWKEEQLAKEKQQLIEKACKLMQHWILEHDYVDIMELEDYIKQKMEDEL